MNSKGIKVKQKKKMCLHLFLIYQLSGLGEMGDSYRSKAS